MGSSGTGCRVEIVRNEAVGFVDRADVIALLLDTSLAAEVVGEIDVALPFHGLKKSPFGQALDGL